MIESAFDSLPFGPQGTLIAVLLLVFLLGFVLDWIEITLIVLPLLAPVVGGMDLAIDGHGVVDSPELVNEQAYDNGWIYKIKLADPSEMDALLSAEAYTEIVEADEH